QLEEAARERAGQMGTAPTPPAPSPSPASRASAPPSGEAEGSPRPRAMVTGLRKSDVPPPRDSLSSTSSITASTSSWAIRRRGAPTGLVVALMILGVLALGAAIFVGVMVLGRND